MKLKALLFLIVFMIFSVNVFSQVLEDIAIIKKRGELLVGICDIETAPFFYKDKNNTLKGIDIDLVKDISKKLGVSYRFINAPSFDKVIDDVYLGKTDIAVSNLSITLERAQKVLFTQSYINLKMSAFVNQLSVDKLKNGDNLELNRNNVKIGVLAGSSYEDFSKSLFPLADIVTFAEWEVILDNVLKKNIDAAFYDEVAIGRTLKKNPSIGLKLKMISFNNTVDPISIAVPNDKIQLFEWLKHYLDINKIDKNIDEYINEYIYDLDLRNIEKVKYVRVKTYNIDMKYTMPGIIIFIGVFFFWKTKSKNKLVNISKFLTSPWTIIISMIAGVFYGIYLKGEQSICFGFGDFYLTLLQMCSLPIMITAIITSLGKLFRTRDSSSYIKKLILLITIVLILASITGVFGGIIGNPGSSLDENAKKILGETVNTTRKAESNILNSESLIKRIIPSNIFSALSSGDVLGILVFSILLGLSLGFLDNNTGEEIFCVLDSLFNSLIQIINWSIYILPIALFALMAKQISGFGPEIIIAMGRFVFIYHILCIIFLIIVIFVISKNTKTSMKKIVKNLKNALIIAFGTSSGYAAMPVAMESLEKNFNVESSKVKLIMPLGLTICRPGTIINLALGTVFIAQLFDVSLFINFRWLGVILGVIVSGFAASGAPGAIEISMLSIFFPFLGLPMEVTTILLLAVNSITDPIRTMLNVMTNSGITILSSKDS
ncbi:MAG: cation:dicarboxylase symporter family transporter [Candidatus Muirbacterium halophilum]|nr:cation:dicarboxylase symporter family transporter [Candidatus Muirbacterium halophilum]MCK9476140.1 cation:dicarboxylase symporter family transporter [Candidatus Muirbacterium halophilum]